MPLIHFTGYVEPRNVKASVGPFTVEELDKSTEMPLRFTVNIADGYVGIECELLRYDPAFLSALSNRATELARVALDMMTFQMGYGFVLVVDRFYDETGKEEILMIKNPFLEGLCTAYSDANFKEFLDLIVYDTHLFMAINDLTIAATASRQAAINCARAMDAVKFMISPGTKDEIGWRRMRGALNISEPYLRFITDFSREHRHGNRTWQASDPLEETLIRSWTVMNRYLVLRRWNLSQLPLEDFSVLNETPQ